MPLPVKPVYQNQEKDRRRQLIDYLSSIRLYIKSKLFIFASL
jgi:hypothetical protein